MNPHVDWFGLARIRVIASWNGSSRIVHGDAVDMAKSSGGGCDLGVDLVGKDHSFIDQERGQFSQAWLVEALVEDQQ